MSSEEDWGYVPMFELGLCDEESPAIRVLDNFEVGPVTLAALTTALFETVMRTLDDSSQLEFEKKYKQALEILLEERYQYDIVMKYPDQDEE